MRMKKDSAIDYAGCLVVKTIGPFFRRMPLAMALCLGRRLGDILYVLDARHRALSYANIKTAFCKVYTPEELKGITRGFYRMFGQNIVEIFLIPMVNKAYIDKYISIENFRYIEEGFRRGRGVILLGVHEGSWELSNVICASLGFPFSLFVREQRFPRLNRLLNFYRRRQGCRIIEKQNQMRRLIEELRENRAVGMTIDQGGRTGMRVEFFGKEASMSTGALKLALRRGATIIPAFYARTHGPRMKIILEAPFELSRSGNEEEELRLNLQRLVRLFEKYILKYPQEYLWTYKVWKYGRQRDVLILADGKTGHLRQAQAVARIVKERLEEKGFEGRIHTVEVRFRNRFSRLALSLWALCGCRGAPLACFLDETGSRELERIKSDIVISCGSSLAALAFLVSRQDLSVSIAVMRPGVLPLGRFGLVVAQRHDRLPRRKNVVTITGALNQMDEGYLAYAAGVVSLQARIRKGLVVGLLVGGDSKGFRLDGETFLLLARQVKAFVEKFDGEILVTTSRRTPPEIDRLAREEFGGYPRCRLLVVANERNIEHGVGGILALSAMVVVTPESISMLSEAASSGRYVLTFWPDRIDAKHRRFLETLNEEGFVCVARPGDLLQRMEEVWSLRPKTRILRDGDLVREAVASLI